MQLDKFEKKELVLLPIRDVKKRDILFTECFNPVVFYGKPTQSVEEFEENILNEYYSTIDRLSRNAGRFDEFNEEYFNAFKKYLPEVLAWVDNEMRYKEELWRTDYKVLIPVIMFVNFAPIDLVDVFIEWANEDKLIDNQDHLWFFMENCVQVLRFIGDHTDDMEYYADLSVDDWGKLLAVYSALSNAEGKTYEELRPPMFNKYKVGCTIEYVEEIKNGELEKTIKVIDVEGDTKPKKYMGITRIAAESAMIHEGIYEIIKDFQFVTIDDVMSGRVCPLDIPEITRKNNLVSERIQEKIANDRKRFKEEGLYDKESLLHNGGIYPRPEDIEEIDALARAEREKEEQKMMEEKEEEKMVEKQEMAEEIKVAEEQKIEQMRKENTMKNTLVQFVPEDMKNMVINNRYNPGDYSYSGTGHVPDDFYVPFGKINPNMVKTHGRDFVEILVNLRGGFDLEQLEVKTVNDRQYVYGFTGTPVFYQQQYCFDGLDYLHSDSKMFAKYSTGIVPETGKERVMFIKDFPKINNYRQLGSINHMDKANETDEKVYYKDYTGHYDDRIIEEVDVESIEVVDNSILVEGAKKAYTKFRNPLIECLKHFNIDTDRLYATNVSMDYHTFEIENIKEGMECDDNTFIAYPEYDFKNLQEDYFFTDLSALGDNVIIKGRDNLPLSPIQIEFNNFYIDRFTSKTLKTSHVSHDSREEDIELRKRLMNHYKNKIIKIKRFSHDRFKRLGEDHPGYKLMLDKEANIYGIDLSDEEIVALQASAKGDVFIVTTMDVSRLAKENSLYFPEADVIITRCNNANVIYKESIVDSYSHPESKLASFLRGELNISNGGKNDFKVMYVNNKNDNREAVYTNIWGLGFKVNPIKNLSKKDGFYLKIGGTEHIVPLDKLANNKIFRSLDEYNSYMDIENVDYKTKFEQALEELKLKKAELELKQREYSVANRDKEIMAEIKIHQAEEDVRRRELESKFREKEAKISNAITRMQYEDELERQEQKHKFDILEMKRKMTEEKIANKLGKHYNYKNKIKQVESPYKEEKSNTLKSIKNVALTGTTVLNLAQKLYKIL